MDRKETGRQKEIEKQRQREREREREGDREREIEEREGLPTKLKGRMGAYQGLVLVGAPSGYEQSGGFQMGMGQN